MIYENYNAFKENVPNFPHRLVGLDIGAKTVGVAVSNSMCTIASPLKTINYTSFQQVISALKEIIEDYNIKTAVIGYPLHMNGEAGERCDFVRKFTEKLLQDLHINYIFWDERLSTMTAERAMLEGDLSRKKRDKRIDQLAASVILQSFVDRLTFQQNNMNS